MCLLSILILELHDFAVLISFQLLTLNLCIDKYIFVSLSPPKWVPLTAPACLVQCNSASCSFGVLLLICGFRYSWYCFPFMNCYSMLCKMINKVNNELHPAKNSCMFCVWLSDKLSIPYAYPWFFFLCPQPQLAVVASQAFCWYRAWYVHNLVPHLCARPGKNLSWVYKDAANAFGPVAPLAAECALVVASCCSVTPSNVHGCFSSWNENRRLAVMLEQQAS